MHKYATRLLPASSVWKPNHTSPPNAWWVLNHWWPNKAASSHQIRYLHRKTRQNINEETFPVWPCWSQKIFKKQDYGRIFPILSNGPNGDISYFIQLFSKYIPGFCEIGLIWCFFVAGGGVWGELREEVLHPVREDRAERHRQHLPNPSRQGLRHRWGGGDCCSCSGWASRRLSRFSLQICSTQYESECLTEQEVHQVCIFQFFIVLLNSDVVCTKIYDKKTLYLDSLAVNLWWSKCRWLPWQQKLWHIWPANNRACFVCVRANRSLTRRDPLEKRTQNKLSSSNSPWAYMILSIAWCGS